MTEQNGLIVEPPAPTPEAALLNAYQAEKFEPIIIEVRRRIIDRCQQGNPPRPDTWPDFIDEVLYQAAVAQAQVESGDRQAAAETLIGLTVTVMAQQAQTLDDEAVSFMEGQG